MRQNSKEKSEKRKDFVNSMLKDISLFDKEKRDSSIMHEKLKVIKISFFTSVFLIKISIFTCVFLIKISNFYYFYKVKSE